MLVGVFYTVCMINSPFTLRILSYPFYPCSDSWTTYLHGPSTNKMGTGANFIRAGIRTEHSVNKPSPEVL